jgi:hypothetical protein
MWMNKKVERSSFLAIDNRFFYLEKSEIYNFGANQKNVYFCRFQTVSMAVDRDVILRFRLSLWKPADHSKFHLWVIYIYNFHTCDCLFYIYMQVTVI